MRCSLLAFVVDQGPDAVLDGELLARRGLVLLADEIRDLLVLGLLNRALVVLLALLQDMLLDPIDTCKIAR